MALTTEELASFCKKKGLVYQSSEIYGGLAGFFDFGPYGVELFNNLKQSFWSYFVHQKENMVGIDASIISHPRTWKASGHIDNFNVNDYLVVCKKCKKSEKVDKPDLGKIKCDCGGEFDWDNAKMIEQMFKTYVGSDRTEAYLRGETAQSMFMNFKLITETSRMKLPFGIAQIGRCFRNEIAPRNFIFRCREFHIGELEFFIHPDEKKCDLLNKEHLNLKLKFLDAETQKKGKSDLKETTIGDMLKEKRLGEWHAYWLAEQIMWMNSILITKIKVREHTKDELSHYSSATFDMDYEYPFGSEEVAGNANRGQFDLNQHIKESKKKLDFFDEEKKDHVIPRVIEPTFGMERLFLAAIVEAYEDDKKRGNVVLKLHPKLSPVKAAVFPLVSNKPELMKKSREVFESIAKEFNCQFDSGGSVGRRYARQDEIGTPFCVTVDFDSLKDKTVTIRSRDTTNQIKVETKNLKTILKKLLDGEKLESFGKILN